MAEYGLGPEAPAPLTSYFDVWRAALTQPSVQTFERIAARPHTGMRQPFRWVLLAAAAASTIFAVYSWLRQGVPLSNALLIIVTIPTLAVLWLWLSATLTHWVARRLSGAGDFTTLVFTFAAVDAPLMAILVLIQLGPSMFQCLTLPLLIYSLVLKGLAVRAVHGFPVGRATLAVMPISIIVVLIPLAAVLYLLSILRAANPSP